MPNFPVASSYEISHDIDMGSSIQNVRKIFRKTNISYPLIRTPDPGRREKINLIFYFHTSLWCLKRFYKGLKADILFKNTYINILELCFECMATVV